MSCLDIQVSDPYAQDGIHLLCRIGDWRLRRAARREREAAVALLRRYGRRVGIHATAAQRNEAKQTDVEGCVGLLPGLEFAVITVGDRDTDLGETADHDGGRVAEVVGKRAADECKAARRRTAELGILVRLLASGCGLYLTVLASDRRLPTGPCPRHWMLTADRCFSRRIFLAISPVISFVTRCHHKRTLYALAMHLTQGRKSARLRYMLALFV